MASATGKRKARNNLNAKILRPKRGGGGKRKAPRKAAPKPGAVADIPVVAIGASAGGLEPIGRFLGAMPADSGLAFVVIQHLDPTSKSLLPELLSKHTAMKVRPAEDDAALRPNEVYVIPPGVYLSIASGKLRFSAAPAGKGARMPIDIFLNSLALDRGNRGIGIIMSGTGTDGAQGLKALKQAGGLALVQDPSEAQQEGMPQYAMLTAHPDDVLAVQDMPAALMRYVGHDYVKAPRAKAGSEEAQAPAEPALAAFVEVLKTSTGQDYGRYKSGTLQRRIERRMALHGIENWADYLALLRKSLSEADALAKDLLINVTRFFRDPEAFAYLGEHVLPRLLQTHAEGQPVRVWVAGCSTGEEVYSLGILLSEKIAAARRRLELQIFATDIDDEALQVARAGIYPESVQADISPERLDKFFVAENQNLKVAKELRDAVVFSRHNVLTDPPFSRLDLVSCRNLLIYLKPDAQARALALFHFALRDDGVLFLGSAESVGSATGLFEPAEEKFRIYRRVGHGRSTRAGAPSLERGRVAPAPAQPIGLAPGRAPSLADLVQRRMLEAYAPAAVVINRALLPLYYFGATGRYLEIVSGEPSQDVLSMAREGLRAKLRETIARAFRGKRRAAAHGVSFKREGRPASVTIEAQRVAEGHDDLVLVSFIDELPRPAGAAHRLAGKTAGKSEVAQLRQQLGDTRKELNRTIADLRRANEALKANNEEAMSLNEEFLSTNEELESSKEELQSLNEELTTVNSQLRQSLDQQQQASTDLSNLLNSSSVATILLDAQLCIKVFNPRMRALFSLIDADIGRPLADLLPKFSDPQLLTDATAARSKGAPGEREIRAETGAWYLRSVLPYRTETGKIHGAVVTFADVSRLKQAELDAAAARAYAETIVDTIREPLIVLDPALRIVSANSAFEAAFDLTPDRLTGRALRDLAHPILAHARLGELLSRMQMQRQETGRVELELDEPAGGYRVWQAVAREFRSPLAERPMILLALDDITDERRIVRRQLQLMIDALPGAFLAVDNERRIRFASSQIEAIFGYRAEELIGQPVDRLVPSETRERHVGLHVAFIKSPKRRPMGAGLDIYGITKDGLKIPMDIGLSPLPTASGVLVIAAIHDLRAQKQVEISLLAAKAEADRANQAKSRFLAAASHDLRQPLQTIGLLLGVLGKRAGDAEARTILKRLDDAVADMASLLDTLLDINQIERGTIKPVIAEFSVGALLTRKAAEFAPLATAKGLSLHMVPSSAVIRSDRQLLERAVGNLLSNAVKYTDRGRILLGCRHRGDKLSIEVWDSGIGIPADEIQSVFDEFYRIDRNDSSKFGLGLGLYIVQRVARLLDHQVEVRSTPGKGTMFALIVSKADSAASAPAGQAVVDAASSPAILLVEDDPAQLDTLRALLELEGFRVVPARKGDDALARLRGPAAVLPDVIVADYNLPGEMTGLALIQRMRAELAAQIPALIVSGDKSALSMKVLDGSGVMFISKPVRAGDLLAAVDALIKIAKPGWSGKAESGAAMIPSRSATPGADAAIIDDEPSVRDAMASMIEAEGYKVTTYASAEAFFADPDRGRFRCLLVDIKLPGMDGFALQERLGSERIDVPIVFVTGSSDLPMAVKAMRSGAADFLQKPVHRAALRESVARIMERGRQSAERSAAQDDVAARIATLTERERQVMERMLEGEATKNIAAGLGISQRTAEHHRQNVMRKMSAKSLALLVRMVGLRDTRR